MSDMNKSIGAHSSSNNIHTNPQQQNNTAGNLIY